MRREISSGGDTGGSGLVSSPGSSPSAGTADRPAPVIDLARRRAARAAQARRARRGAANRTLERASVALALGVMVLAGIVLFGVLAVTMARHTWFALRVGLPLAAIACTALAWGAAGRFVAEPEPRLETDRPGTGSAGR